VNHQLNNISTISTISTTPLITQELHIGYCEERVIARFRGYCLSLSEEDKLK
jgi:hypothetical protein